MEKQHLEWSEAIQQKIQSDKEKKDWQEERKSDYKMAIDEVHDRIYNSDEPFDYDDIEEIMLGYGFEMDGIESYL